MPLYLQLHLLIFILAITAVLGRLIGLPAPALVFWRTVFAAMILWIWQRVKKERFRSITRPSDRLQALGTGGILGIHWVLFFGSIQLANVSICLAGMATIAFFTALVEPLLTKSRFRGADLLLGLMIIPGLILIAGSGGNHLLGLLCSCAAALFAAIFSVLNRRFALQGIAPEAITFYEMIGAALFCMLIWPFFNFPMSAFFPVPQDFVWLLLLAGLCTAFAFSFYVYLLRYFTAFTSNLAASFEPIYGMVLAAVIFGEHHSFSFFFYLGVLTILMANILHMMLQKRNSRILMKHG